MTEKIIELEYTYIKETVHQAVEDRYKMLNFYIALATAAGSVMVGVSTAVSGDIRGGAGAAWALALLSFGTAVVGWIFLAIMLRLRQAWHESIIAMNHLKTAIVEADMASRLFLWDQTTVPRPARLWSIHFFASLLIILLNSSFLALSVIFAQQSVQVAAGILLGSVVAQFILYQYSLNHHK